MSSERVPNVVGFGPPVHTIDVGSHFSWLKFSFSFRFTFTQVVRLDT